MLQVHFWPLDLNVTFSVLRMLLVPSLLFSCLRLLVLLCISLPMSFPGEVLSDRFNLNYTLLSIIFCPCPQDIF